MELISLEKIYKLLAEVCDLLNKNTIDYLVYGSTAVNLLTSQKNEVHDLDIIVKEADFDKIKNLLTDSFDPIQTEFSIHANSKEYLGSNNKPFDISFDSYEHYFESDGVDLNNFVEIDLEGVKIKVTLKEELKKLYEINIRSGLNPLKAQSYKEKIELLSK